MVIRMSASSMRTTRGISILASTGPTRPPNTPPGGRPAGGPGRPHYVARGPRLRVPGRCRIAGLHPASSAEPVSRVPGLRHGRASLRAVHRRPVRVSLRAVRSPARFAVYDVDAFGTPHVIMNSGDGITAADSVILPAGGHRHVNWAFTWPGTCGRRREGGGKPPL